MMSNWKRMPLSLKFVAILLLGVGAHSIIYESIFRTIAQAKATLHLNPSGIIGIIAGIGILQLQDYGRYCGFGFAALKMFGSVLWNVILVLILPSMLPEAARPHSGDLAKAILATPNVSWLALTGSLWVIMVLMRKDVRALFASVAHATPPNQSLQPTAPRQP